MEERGRVQVGAIADLVLFDPATVSDHSTYAEGSRPATFAYVFVAGQPVVKADRVDLGATPGRALRSSPDDFPLRTIPLPGQEHGWGGFEPYFQVGAAGASPRGVAAPWPPVAPKRRPGKRGGVMGLGAQRWAGSPLCLKAQTGSAPYFDDAPLLLMSEASLTSPGAGENAASGQTF